MPSKLRADQLSAIRESMMRFMQGRGKIRTGVLFPDSVAMPNSSLAHYLDLALTHFGSEGSINLYPGGSLDIELDLQEFNKREASPGPGDQNEFGMGRELFGLFRANALSAEDRGIWATQFGGLDLAALARDLEA